MVQSITNADAVSVPLTHAASMVALFEAALKNNIGVNSVSVDGFTTSFNRQQAISELNYWKRRVGAEPGSRPLKMRIKLD